jgi:hypothetical protein
LKINLTSLLQERLGIFFFNLPRTTDQIRQIRIEEKPRLYLRNTRRRARAVRNNSYVSFLAPAVSSRSDPSFMTLAARSDRIIRHEKTCTVTTTREYVCMYVCMCPTGPNVFLAH